MGAWSWDGDRSRPPTATILFGLALLAVGLGLAFPHFFAAMGGPSSLFLYTRLSKVEVVRQPVRRKVLDVVRGGGWIPLPELQARLGLPRSTLRHHLRVLRRASEVALRVFEGTTLVSVGQPAPPRSAVELAFDQVGPSAEVRLASLIRVLVVNHGYERTGAWRAVQRLVRDARATVIRRNHGAWVCLTNGQHERDDLRARHSSLVSTLPGRAGQSVGVPTQSAAPLAAPGPLGAVGASTTN